MPLLPCCQHGMQTSACVGCASGRPLHSDAHAGPALPCPQLANQQADGCAHSLPGAQAGKVGRESVVEGKGAVGLEGLHRGTATGRAQRFRKSVQGGQSYAFGYRVGGGTQEGDQAACHISNASGAPPTPQTQAAAARMHAFSLSIQVLKPQMHAPLSNHRCMRRAPWQTRRARQSRCRRGRLLGGAGRQRDQEGLVRGRRSDGLRARQGGAVADCWARALPRGLAACQGGAEGAAEASRGWV